jgi:DNA-binding response OmpR family regulator
MAKVLIIESDAEVARQLADALSRKGLDSRITADGTEGLALARTEQPRLIVLCVELSRVSGYSICNKLKKDPDLGQIPLILTSSQATEETFEQHKKLKTRAEAYLKKPYADAEIMGLIAQYMRGGAGQKATVEAGADEVAVEVDDPPARSSPKSSAVDLDLSELESSTRQRTVVDRPAARPAAAASAASTDEMRQLRQKLQKLEQTLEQKELEFNDRLLQESSRSRESVDVKKKAVLVERDLEKYKQVAERSKQEADQMRAELTELREQNRGGDSERQNLSDKIGQLVDKVKSLAAERDSLQKRVAELTQQAEELARVREKAKKAVDIAAQLIGETGLVQ